MSNNLFGITHAEGPAPGPKLRQQRRAPSATYDAADTNAGNSRHWANADGLSAKAANSPEVRRKLRERARLEFDNGGNCKGAIETIAHDLIGTGPRLQLTLPKGSDQNAAKIIEQKFRDWCDDKAVGFVDKLRVMCESELRDGESFAVFVDNPAVTAGITFDVRVLETEQVATPFLDSTKPDAVDGIEFDSYGNPTFYHILKSHPGDTAWYADAGVTPTPAYLVVHWFRPSRAGAARGIPRITPGLPLMAQIRGYCSATLAAARLAATLAGVMETNLPPDGGPVEVEAYDSVPFEDGTMLTLPAGWRATQVKAEQPTSTHRDFKDTCLTEFGRALHTPRNVVTGDSSGYNFSSARLDHLIYRGAMRIERNRLAVRVLDPVFRAWLKQAIMTPGYLPFASLPPVDTWVWVWQFDGFPSINPVDDAAADETNLKNGLTSHAEILAARGVDWEVHFASLARQRQRARELGIEDLLYPWLAKTEPAMPAEPRGNQSEVDTVIDEEEEAHALVA